MNKRNGYTLEELIIVMAILLILFGIGAANMMKGQFTNSLTTTTDVFVADVKTQQLKAILGATEGRATTDLYGIHFNTSPAISYVLFHGSVYNSLDTSNITINLGDNIQFANDLFAGGQIIFKRGSGEINGFVNGANSIQLKNVLSNEIRTVTFNKFGVITSIN